MGQPGGLQGVLEGMDRRGLLEDLQLGTELAVSSFFGTLRHALRSVSALHPVGAPGAPSSPEVQVERPSAYPASGPGLAPAPDGDNKRQRPSWPLWHRGRGPQKPAVEFPSQLRRQLLGTDSLNSTEGLVRAAGYPYEAHEVETEDGYLLRLDRIPRAGATECAFLLHGVLDSSMGWVANGALGSIGFAAFDRGFDVFLGNCRGVPPKRHREGNLGREYWDYSVNEIGLHDVSAMLRGVHCIKVQELCPGAVGAGGKVPSEGDTAGGECGSPGGRPHWRRGDGLGTPVTVEAAAGTPEYGRVSSALEFITSRSPAGKLRQLGSVAREWVGGGGGLGSGGLPTREEASSPARGGGLGSGRRGQGTPKRRTPMGGGGEVPPLPYRLQAVGHSLGGMALLIHQTTAWRRPDPQYIQRLVLLTPAGFHHLRVPLVGWIFVVFYCSRLLQGHSGVYLTHFLLRVLVHKLAKDLHGMPALGHLSNVLCGLFMAGDASRWDKAALMPHYSADSMPAFSKGVARHIAQCVLSRRFQLYDYGSAERNLRAYGRARPPDVGSSYWRVDVPVDLVAGTNDGIIAPENVREHLHRFKSQGVDVSYSEFEFGHVDFTFAPSDALIRHIFSCLLK